MNHISSPNEPHPAATSLAQATTTHTQGPFTVASRKLPISKSGPIDAMSARLAIPIPEMIFGDNLVAIAHAPSGWSIEFTAEAALDAVDKTGANMLQVAYAGEWSSSREKSSAHDIQQVVKPYDWSYSTTYKGTEKIPGAEAAEGEGQAEGGRRMLAATADKQIPLELLKRRDPILFFDEVVLFESELDDNGVSIYSVKVRVMEQRMLLLARLYMRLDNVVVRVRDTRVYVEFGTGEVVREYTVKEDSFANVKKSLMMTGLGPEAVTSALRDANQVAQLLPVVDQQIDTVTLSS
ncbi:Tap42 interacting protein [Gnomoniopsis sp. IMI 355080]|nr:Tap42 interacting protein [Gnomoniopsis sp. IMI 355080]